MGSHKKSTKQEIKEKQQDKIARKEAFRQFKKQFVPLILAVALWLITSAILHLPAFREQVQEFFVRFTLNSAVAFSKLLFIPVVSHGFPKITVAGFTMEVIMECTAYNFYIFVFFLSIFSPVHWTKRLLTLAIFLLAIFVVNNFRFYTMGFIGNHFMEYFHNIHDYLWNILFGFMVFLIWLWRYRDVEKKPSLNTSQ